MQYLNISFPIRDNKTNEVICTLSSKDVNETTYKKKSNLSLVILELR